MRRLAVAVLALLTGSMGFPVGLQRRTLRTLPSRTRVAAVEELEALEDAAEDASYLMSTVERARTVASSCICGTLCTIDKDGGVPFGSHVDYVLDAKGWPVLLVSDQSLHTLNLRENPSASMFIQMPADTSRGQTNAAMSRISLVGTVVPVDDADELFTIRTDYTVAHEYALRLVESPKFSFVKVRPEKIYYVGGFGVNSQWVDVEEYQEASPDTLALEAQKLVSKINTEQGQDLKSLTEQFIGINDMTEVRVTTIDRLGMTLRITHGPGGQRTDEFRVGFPIKILNMEDAKSEIVKIFQEAWEKEQGEEWEDMGPPIVKTTSDILK